jgi:predicted hotdog family 3-hydroxylacyl-ACP dehydratase
MDAETDILKLVPHRPPTLLIDRVVRHDAESLEAIYRVPESSFLGRGPMPAYAGIEILAQAIAALENARGRDRGETRPPTMGVLLGTRLYRCEVPTFDPGEELRITVREKMSDPSGFGAFEGILDGADGTRLVESVIKVYRPPNFWAYISRTPTP